MNSSTMAPKATKLFRRGQRVRRPIPKANCPWMAATGTVLNPDKKSYWPRNGDLLVSVRWDDQQPDENGGSAWQSELTAETSGETQYEKRRYNLRWLSHDEIALIRDVLGGDMRPEAAELLKKVPELPS